MDVLMYIQVTPHLEWYITNITSLRTFTICAMVHLQMTLFSEWFITNVTGIWAFSTIMHWCAFRWPCLLNYLLQTAQVQGRAPLCMCSCCFRHLSKLNDFLQMLQIFRCSPLHMCWWLDISLVPAWFINIIVIQVPSPTYTLLSWHSTLLTECCITHIHGTWTIHSRDMLMFI